MGAYAKKTRKSRMMRGGEKPSNANGNVGNQNELPPEVTSSSQTGNQTEDPPSSQAGNQTDDPPSSQAGNQTEDQAAAKKSEAASGAVTNAEKGVTKESLIALLNKETNPEDKIKKAKIDLAIAILNETKTFTPEYLSSLHAILSKQT